MKSYVYNGPAEVVRAGGYKWRKGVPRTLKPTDRGIPDLAKHGVVEYVPPVPAPRVTQTEAEPVVEQHPVYRPPARATRRRTMDED